MNRRAGLVLTALFLSSIIALALGPFSDGPSGGSGLRVFEPEPGFELALDGYRWTHLGATSVPSAEGPLETVQVVREESERSGLRYTTFLYLSEDFRRVKSGHVICPEIDPCLGELFAWPGAGGSPWLFGLSPLFGSPFSTVLPPDLPPHWDKCAGIVDARALQPNWSITPTLTAYGGLLCLDGRGRPERVIPKDDGDEMVAQRSSMISIDLSPGLGKALPSTPMSARTQEFPYERSTNYTQFPWAEASVHVAGQLEAGERVVQFSHPLNSSDATVLDRPFSREWSWDVVLDGPGTELRALQVLKKAGIAQAEPSYEIRPGSLGNRGDMVSFVEHHESVEVDAFVDYAERAMGVGASSVWGIIDPWTNGTEWRRQVFVQPNISSEDGDSTVSIHNIGWNADDGRLVQMFLPRELLHRILYDEPPGGRR